MNSSLVGHAVACPCLVLEKYARDNNVDWYCGASTPALSHLEDGEELSREPVSRKYNYDLTRQNKEPDTGRSVGFHFG
jgi:hypothetical protein